MNTYILSYPRTNQAERNGVQLLFSFPSFFQRELAMVDMGIFCYLFIAIFGRLRKDMHSLGVFFFFFFSRCMVG
jgi:hypothetical protein